jgi:hypothetical protein
MDSLELQGLVSLSYVSNQNMCSHSWVLSQFGLTDRSKIFPSVPVIMVFLQRLGDIGAEEASSD